MTSTSAKVATTAIRSRAAVPIRDRTLRRVFEGGRVRLRPRPFQWGSKRTGPDLHRVGGKYPSLWHVRHMARPASTTPGSVMPRYPHLLDRQLRHEPDRREDAAPCSRSGCRTPTARSRRPPPPCGRRPPPLPRTSQLQQGPTGLADKEIVALTAYLQRLGTDIKWKRPLPQSPVSATPVPAPAPAARPCVGAR